MFKLLAKTFIKNHDELNDVRVREKYGILSGVLGIICNVVLFIVKIVIGAIMNSIAIISDAFNNLSDVGSSVISIFSAKLSNAKADEEHPFGHGRFEYIGSLIVSFIILLVGIELIKTSFDKLINPTPVNFSVPLIIILTVSLLIKVWMWIYNNYVAKLINSSVNKATATDSLNDVFSTSGIIISTIIGSFVNFPLDGIIGLVVSVLIILSGINIAKETIGVLLGTPPSKELVENLTNMIMDSEVIIGVHDLIVHDYGPGRKMASVHAEVSDTINIVVAHEEIDRIEEYIFQETGIHMVIHMDPVSLNCPHTNLLKTKLQEIIDTHEFKVSFHDLRVVNGEHQINVIFDLVVPFNASNEERVNYKHVICQELTAIDSRYHCVIKFEHNLSHNEE